MSNRTAPKMAATIVAAAILAACSGGTAESANNDTAEAVANEAASEAAAANDAAPAATPAAAPAGLGPDFMVGKWSAMGSCDDTIEFRKDGSVVTPFGPGRWTLAGDQLSIAFDDDTGKQSPSTIARVDDKTIRITQASGKSETQIRC